MADGGINVDRLESPILPRTEPKSKVKPLSPAPKVVPIVDSAPSKIASIRKTLSRLSNAAKFKDVRSARTTNITRKTAEEGSQEELTSSDNVTDGDPHSDSYDFTKEKWKTIGNVTALHDDVLEFTHYTTHNPEDEGEKKPSVEFFISDEAKKLGLDFKTMRRLVDEELKRIHSDPFGETSIDPALKAKDWGTRRLGVSRSINKVTEEAQQLITEPIVIKTSRAPEVELPSGGPAVNTRPYKEDLIEQYQVMRELDHLTRQKFSPEQQEVLRFAKVYGVLRVEAMEYLFMEHVTGEPTREVYPGYHIANEGGMDHWVDVAEHERLLERFPSFAEKIYTDPDNGRRYISLYRVRNRLGDMLGVEGLDMGGRNIIQHTIGDSNQYVIIDQNLPGKFM